MTEHTNVNFELLAETFSLPQAERLAYIDLSIRYLGDVARADIMDEFRIASAAASKDLNLYRELKPGNCQIDTKSKRTVITEDSYSPLVYMNVHTALNLIQNGFCRTELMKKRPMLTVENVDPSFQPDRLKEEQVSVVTRAIHKRCGVMCTYGSKSSDHRLRTLFPTALFIDRKNWYFRAYDRNTNEPQNSGFKNFKLSRIFDITYAQSVTPYPSELLESDAEWERDVTFIIKFKDNLPEERVKEIGREFAIKDQIHSISCKAALACFIKENWKIDLNKDNNENLYYYFDALNVDTLKKVNSLKNLFK